VVEQDNPESPQPEQPRRPGVERPQNDPPPASVSITPRPQNDPPPASVSITPVPVEEHHDTAEQRPVPAAPVVTASGGTQYDAAGLPVGPLHIEPTSDEPSRLVGKYLFDTERYCGEWRRHWIYVARWTTIGALSPFLVGYLVGLIGETSGPLITALVFGWLALLVFVGFKLLDWYYDRFVLTNKRVMVVRGLVTRQVGMMPLARVTDMAYNQSPLGRILNYGTFVLESAGQDQALREIKPLPRPSELYLLFVQEMYEPGAPTKGRSGGDGEGD
jgi:membrane protein YdbS with pleckstrin-like domain